MSGIDVPMSVFSDAAEFIQATREGIAGKVVSQAVDVIGQRDLFARLVGVLPENLQQVYRRARLGPVQSEALLDALRVFYRASTALGGLDAALEWLDQPIPALGGQRPLDLCETFIGRLLVQQAIARIEHGEFP